MLEDNRKEILRIYKKYKDKIKILEETHEENISYIQKMHKNEIDSLNTELKTV